MFPEAGIADAIQVLDGSDLPPGYGGSVELKKIIIIHPVNGIFGND